MITMAHTAQDGEFGFEDVYDLDDTANHLVDDLENDNDEDGDDNFDDEKCGNLESDTNATGNLRSMANWGERRASAERLAISRSLGAEQTLGMPPAIMLTTPTATRGRSVTFDDTANAPSPATANMQATAKAAEEFQASIQTMLHRQNSGEWARTRNDSADSLEVKASPTDFKLLKVIGQGAYGRVFQVRHSKSNEIYAMKVLAKGQVLEKNNLSYVREERNILSKANHPFVVKLMCAFQTPNKLYLVMEYVCGGELFSHIRDEGLFEEGQARFYAAEMILAIEYLHQNGIIHRDLKPENVLLDASGHIRITDFGLATENRSEARTLCGTDLYMAPEMIAGSGYGKAVDYWSLGAILFEMLTGDTPFYAKDTKRLYRLILGNKPKFPRWLSRDCTSLLKGLLNRNVEQRLGAAPATMFKVGGVQELKEHDFFKEIDWNALLALQLNPPFRPPLQDGILDTSNFSENFTNLHPQALHDEMDTEEAKKFLDEASAGDFEGFSFTHPNYIEKAMEKIRVSGTQGDGDDYFKNDNDDDDKDDEEDKCGSQENNGGFPASMTRSPVLSAAAAATFKREFVPLEQTANTDRTSSHSMIGQQFSYRDMLVKEGSNAECNSSEDGPGDSEGGQAQSNATISSSHLPSENRSETVDRAIPTDSSKVPVQKVLRAPPGLPLPSTTKATPPQESSREDNPSAKAGERVTKQSPVDDSNSLANPPPAPKKLSASAAEWVPPWLQ